MTMFEIAAGYESDGRNITTSLHVVPADNAQHACERLIPSWWTITYADDTLVVAESEGGLWFQCNLALPVGEIV